MLHGLKTAALLLGALSLAAAAPSTASAQLFPWLYDAWYGPGWYGSYYRGYYGPPTYQTALYAGGWDCGCQVACAPCGPCGPVGCSPCGTVGCSPCGAGGCGPGGCQWNAPAGTSAPIPDTNLDRPDADAPPARSRPETFRDETDPQNGINYERPSTGSDRGSSGSGRTTPGSRFRDNSGTPADDGTRDRFKPRGSGTDSGTGSDGTGTPGDSTKDFGVDSSSSFESNKPILGEGTATPPLGSEIVIPQQKPADIAPIDDSSPVRDAGALDTKTTSKPVIDLHRMALRANFAAPKLVRTNVRPASEWSAAPTDARIARH